MDVDSVSALALRLAPTSSSAVAKPRALRCTVPRLSMEAVNPARPGRSRGSRSPPAGMLARIAIVGVAWLSRIDDRDAVAEGEAQSPGGSAPGRPAREAGEWAGRPLGPLPPGGASRGRRGGPTARRTGLKWPIVRHRAVNVRRAAPDVGRRERADPVEIGGEKSASPRSSPSSPVDAPGRSRCSPGTRSRLRPSLGASQLSSVMGDAPTRPPLFEEPGLEALPADPGRAVAFT